VGPNAGGGSNGGSSGFHVFGRPGRDKKDDGSASSAKAAFTGSGTVLGSANTEESRSRIPLLGPWGNAGSKMGEDSLTDRREKARMAALARMARGESESD
jgi:hypothetical protein